MSTAKTPRRRRPKPGDIASLRRVLWAAIRECEAMYETDVDADTKLKAFNTIATLSGVYMKTAEAHEAEKAMSEVQERVRALEEASLRA
jgi:hypothetical protein